MKKLDLAKSVYDLTEAYPELIDILKDLCFLGVRSPVVRNTLGRVTTIPQGCAKQGKDLDAVVQALKDKGFDVVPEP